MPARAPRAQAAARGVATALALVAIVAPPRPRSRRGCGAVRSSRRRPWPRRPRASARRRRARSAAGRPRRARDGPARGVVALRAAARRSEALCRACTTFQASCAWQRGARMDALAARCRTLDAHGARSAGRCDASSRLGCARRLRAARGDGAVRADASSTTRTTSSAGPARPRARRTCSPGDVLVRVPLVARRRRRRSSSGTWSCCCCAERTGARRWQATGRLGAVDRRWRGVRAGAGRWARRRGHGSRYSSTLIPYRFIQRCTCIRSLPSSRPTAATLPWWRVEQVPQLLLRRRRRRERGGGWTHAAASGGTAGTPRDAALALALAIDVWASRSLRRLPARRSCA